MTEHKPKIGKKGGLKEVAKKLADLRKRPVSQEVLEIVDENYERNQKQKDKRAAKPSGDVEI